MQASGRARLPALRENRTVAYAVLAVLIAIPVVVFVIAGVDARGINLEGAGGPLIAFSAGVLSFVSPCVLPLVPIYVTNLAGASVDADGHITASRSQTFSHAVAFLAGLSVVFITLGASVGFIGYAVLDNQRNLEQIAGVLMIGLGILIVPELGSRSVLRSVLLLAALAATFLVLVDLAHISNDTFRLALLGGAMVAVWLRFAGYLPTISLIQRTLQFSPGRDRPASYTRSALIGGAFATGWTPCIGPILGGILTLAATSGDAFQGAYLLSAYSLGFSIPFLVTGLAVSDASRGIRKLQRYMPAFEVASGIMLLGLGILLLTGRLTQLNEFFGFAEFNPGL
jgi:cytochrome c-type biogenesis protein